MLKMMFILVAILFSEFFSKKFWMMKILLFYYFFMFMILFMNLNVTLNFLNILFLDYISYFLIMLSIWIISLMFMASEKVIFLKNNEFFFKLMIYFLLLFLILTFLSNNFFLFYMFFESSLIPTLILILGWGYQPERINAGLYLLIYTLFASLPLLMSLIYLSMENFSMFLMNYGLDLSFNNLNYTLFYFSLVMAFLVKMPMFLIHLWLPKAHVEAPISGSMILAGVLLKLGGYGLMRVLILLTKFNLKFGNWWISISLIGGVLISLNCLCQMDLKSLIAYSSVAHMSLVMGGIFTLYYWGVNGCFFMMIAHGLCSSGLFCLSNISYERMFSRMLLINKGMLNYLPTLTFWWFLLSSSSMSAPPSFNLLSEIMLINSLVSWSIFTFLFLMLILFFSASYMYYLYSYSQHGQLYSGVFCYSSGNNREFILLFFHWLPLNLMFIKSNFFLV